jgi:uncharacterized membrane protein YeaQ/YmgE (transglycosylase-associated protein family)
MHILAALVTGAVVGVLARLLIPGRDPGGVVVTVLLGMAGGLVASFIGRAIGWYRPGFTAPGILASTLGAMVLLLLYRL